MNKICIKIKLNPKRKQVWNMIWMVLGKNSKNAKKYLIDNNLKTKQRIQLGEKISENSFSKYQNKTFQIIKQNKEKRKVIFKSENKDNYNDPFNKTELEVPYVGYG